MMKKIISKLLTPNPMSRPQTKLPKVKKIVIHYVANPMSSAMANRNYFDNLKDQKKIYASSHYIIDLDGDIIQCIPENEVSYHAGNYQVNLESIGIENCHPKADGKFNKETYDSLIELCADICKRHNLDPIKDVIRHYDVTGKLCPLYYVNNQKEWDRLKIDIQTKMKLNDPSTSNLRLWYRVVAESNLNRENSEKTVLKLKEYGYTAFIEEYEEKK